ncbi:MAG: hypothetical protein GYB31_20545 [Bacteroidetes bacterium]|nr:hypothetical protein [Bacteroidota bacterium]
MLRFLTIIMLLSGSLSMSAQESPSYRGSWSVAYYGNIIWNPGLRFSLDKPVQIRQSAPGKIVRSWHINASLGGYWDPLSHIGLVNDYQLHYRIMAPQFMSIRGGFGAGYFRTFLPNVYEFNEQGVAEKVPFAGRNYLTFSMMLGIESFNKKHPNRTWFLNIDSNIAFPSNGFFYPLIFLEMGYRFSFK